MLNIHTIVTFTVFKKTYLKCISGEIHSVCLGFEMEVLATDVLQNCSVYFLLWVLWDTAALSAQILKQSTVICECTVDLSCTYTFLPLSAIALCCSIQCILP